MESHSFYVNKKKRVVPGVGVGVDNPIIINTGPKCSLVVWSVVHCLSYRYRADKSTIFGMRDLWGLTIN